MALTTISIDGMTTDKTHQSLRSYRNLFIVQNRYYWKVCPFHYDKESDIVLTFDFALVNEIRAQGGTATYLDHLVAPDTMERHNIETYHFFENWYRDKENNDIFSYRGIVIGNALRLDIWNDVTCYVRIVVNLLTIKSLDYEQMYVGLEDSSALDALARLGMTHEVWNCNSSKTQPGYYYPIFRCMRECIRPMYGIKSRLKAFLSLMLDLALQWGERLRLLRTAKIDIVVELGEGQVVVQGTYEYLVRNSLCFRKVAMASSNNL